MTIPDGFRESGVSGATLRNWEKLNTETTGRLTTRANKHRSRKRILPLEYFRNRDNIPCVQSMIDCIDANELDIMSVLLSLGTSLLKRAGIYDKPHVAAALKEYADIPLIDGLSAKELPNDEYDILGLIYQAFLREGKKNITGAYYTPREIAVNMTRNFDFSGGELFLDPCCGSGAFLLSVSAEDPAQIYGTDNDNAAVLISKINLLLKYPKAAFIPQVYCLDYPEGSPSPDSHPIFNMKFDYIATNPPWGAVQGNGGRAGGAESDGSRAGGAEGITGGTPESAAGAGGAESDDGRTGGAEGITGGTPASAASADGAGGAGKRAGGAEGITGSTPASAASADGAGGAGKRAGGAEDITGSAGIAEDSEKRKSSVTFRESFSDFFVKAYGQLKDGGTIRFLFPKAILNVGAHRDIRKFIAETAGLVSITMYDDMFAGVTTKYVDIECGGAPGEHFTVFEGAGKRTVSIETIYETNNLVFSLLSAGDMEIIRMVREKGKYSLSGSVWALGIVTGDNKHKLNHECLEGMERIYTGKEIESYVLKPARNYIRFSRADLQQVAAEEIYRAPEKLVYKFISGKLEFAYDNSRSLFLNSANILIPDIPSMSIKTVMAFLNSALFRFVYKKLFGEVKVLKGNLTELTFPEISPDDDKLLSGLVDGILSGDEAGREGIDDAGREVALPGAGRCAGAGLENIVGAGQEGIDRFIFSLYGLSGEQAEYVLREVDG